MNLILNFKKWRPKKAGIFLAAIPRQNNDGRMCVIEVWTGWELKDGWEGFEHLKDDELYLFKGNGTHELVGEIGELLSNCEISWHAEIPLFECLGDFYSENNDEAFDFGSYRERLDLIKSRSDYHKLYESSFVKIKRKL